MPGEPRDCPLCPAGQVVQPHVASSGLRMLAQACCEGFLGPTTAGEQHLDIVLELALASFLQSVVHRIYPFAHALSAYCTVDRSLIKEQFIVCSEYFAMLPKHGSVRPVNC